jgi:hypothetical protein
MIFRKLKRLIKDQPFTRSNLYFKEISISQCVHFCGYKYGSNDYHPYQSFILEYYHNPENVEKTKRQFVNFLKFYRPQNLGEALGLKLEREYPLWVFPWANHPENDYKYKNAWLHDPDDIVDIMTHFSEKGILSYHIDREFYWLQRAVFNIKTQGYKPKEFGYIDTLMFQKKNNDQAFLLLDGNHRISAVYAAGQNQAAVKVSKIIYENDVEIWPGVQNGFYKHDDALKIFNRYFEGNKLYFTTDNPAKIIDYSNNYQRLTK